MQSVHSGSAALEWLRENRTPLLLLDLHLPDMDGAGVLDALASASPDPVPFVIISGLADTRVAVEYMRRGAIDYLIKDRDFLDLVPDVVHRALQSVERDAQLARLQREIIEISEREQRRIGHDLHDDLCQRLAALKMQTQDLGFALGSLDPALARKADIIAGHLSDAVRVSRALARGLSPVAIGAEGLPAALSGLARNAEEIFQIACVFESHHPCPTLSHHVATQIYRIAQEGISNAVKHARAGLVTLDLRVSGGLLTLTVGNDGLPFDPSRPQAGMGLQIMRHRTDSIGGSLAFDHHPADGTTTAVTLTLPLTPTLPDTTQP